MSFFLSFSLRKKWNVFLWKRIEYIFLAVTEVEENFVEKRRKALEAKEIF